MNRSISKIFLLQICGVLFCPDFSRTLRPIYSRHLFWRASALISTPNPVLFSTTVIPESDMLENIQDDDLEPKRIFHNFIKLLLKQGFVQYLKLRMIKDRFVKRGLTDKPGTVLESPDNSEQNRGGYFFDFFFEIVLHGALIIYIFQ